MVPWTFPRCQTTGNGHVYCNNQINKGMTEVMNGHDVFNQTSVTMQIEGIFVSNNVF